MQLKPIVAIAVLFLVVASLSVAGCTIGLPTSSTPTPSPTSTPMPTAIPPRDYSSFFANRYESVDSIIVQPFTKAGTSNMRGNDVYRGVIRNASLPGSLSTTIVVELTQSKSQAKQLFDSEVAAKQSLGYVYNSERTTSWKAFEKGAYVQIGEAWIGNDNAGHSFLTATENNTDTGHWLFVTQAMG